MSGRPIVESAADKAEKSEPSPASRLAREIKTLVEAGARDEARDRFGALVALVQRRALRIAFHYLRDAADADEAVQDAFVKVFLNIDRYREELSFDLWFTRILVNACLDRLKGRTRKQRWMVSTTDDEAGGRLLEQLPAPADSGEHQLLARERWQRVGKAIAALPDRQRLVFTLAHLGDQTAAEISATTGMSPATVRVHLFRAVRKLRTLLGEHA